LTPIINRLIEALGGHVTVYDGSQYLVFWALAILTATVGARLLDTTGHAMAVWGIALGSAVMQAEINLLAFENDLLLPFLVITYMPVLVALAATSPLFAYLRVARKQPPSSNPRTGERGRSALALGLGFVLVAYGMILAILLALSVAGTIREWHDQEIGWARTSTIHSISADLASHIPTVDLDPRELFGRLLRHATASNMDLYLFRLKAIPNNAEHGWGSSYEFVVGTRKSHSETGPRFVVFSDMNKLPPREREGLRNRLEPILNSSAESPVSAGYSLNGDGLVFEARIPMMPAEQVPIMYNRSAGGYVLVDEQPKADTPFLLLGTPRSRGLISLDDVGLITPLSPWILLALLFPVSLAFIGYYYLRRRDMREHALLERQRIQQDAHDRVYNRLSALSKRVELTADDLTAEVRAGLGAVADDIRRTVGDLQVILDDAHAPGAGDAAAAAPGLLETQLRETCASQAVRYGIAVDFESEGPVADVAPSLGWDLQCVVEEAVTNAARHGGASHVRVSAVHEGGVLRITVADDGSGLPEDFDIEEVPASSTGLRGMRTRLERAGGSLAIEGSSAGARITAEIPAGDNAG
jgi:signal transduction histidine kinase